ncbi:MAG: universal stress protein [Bacteroidales bacterium]|nr:universal stress protein [Bacteroidales bacterium]
MGKNLKITVLSNVDQNDSGIIPYALKISKDLKGEVNVIHVIDTRTSQGIYTPYSDSQSVTPGVESYHDILAKKQEVVEDYLAKHMGREVSVLNYPLRVNYEVQLGHLDEIIIEKTEKDNDLLVMNARPKGKVWENYEEVFDIISITGNPVLLIPQNIKYRTPREIAFVENMENDHSDQMKKLLEIFEEVPIQLLAVNISGNGDLKQKLKTDPSWQHIVSKWDQYLAIPEAETDEILAVANQHRADLIILFEKKRNLLKRIISKSLTEKLAEKSDKPLLVFYN